MAPLNSTEFGAQLGPWNSRPVLSYSSVTNRFTYVSTAGGAFLEGSTVPGIVVLGRQS